MSLMPTTAVPPDVQGFLRQPNPCVVATVDLHGELHTAATWYAWLDDGTVLLNMDESRRRLEHLCRDPRIALTVLDADNWYRHVSIDRRRQPLAQLGQPVTFRGPPGPRQATGPEAGIVACLGPGGPRKVT